MSPSQPKPCPFCGSTETEQTTDDPVFWWECLPCGAKADGKRWNSRPLEEALEARVAELTQRAELAERAATDQHDAYERERDSLRNRVAELEADRERLDWVESLAADFYVDLHSKCVVDDTLPTPAWCLVCFGDDEQVDANGVPKPDGPCAEWLPTLRGVIDAARTSGERKEGDG